MFEQETAIQGMANLEKWNNDFQLELKKFDFVTNIRQQGTILAFEIETGEGNTYFSDIKAEAYAHFMDAGILLRPLGNVIFINAPFVISKEDYKLITDSIISFLSKGND